MSSNSKPSSPGEQIYETLVRAAQLHQAGRLAEAERLYRAVLQADPHNADANHNLGVLAMQVDRPALALPHFKLAAESQPLHTQFWLDHVRALVHTGDPETARRVHAEGRARGLQGPDVAYFESRLAADQPPNSAAPAGATLKAAGPSNDEQAALVELFRRGRFAEAEAAARGLTNRFPAHGFGWKALGTALSRLGRSEQALAPLEQAARLSPADPEAHKNLASILRQLGLLGQAEAAFAGALALAPEDADTLLGLGDVLCLLHRLGDAEAALRRALGYRPNHAATHVCLGNVLREQRRLDEAAASYRRALELEPDDFEAYGRLGQLLYQQGLLSEAEAVCRRALAARPDEAGLHVDLGRVLRDQGLADRAQACFRHALNLKPDDLEARSSLLFAINYAGTLSAAECLALARDYGACVTRKAGLGFSSWLWPRPAEQLRVGLVSGDLREHPVGYFLDSVLPRLDPQRIELVAYATHTEEDDLSIRLKRSFAAWHTLAGLSDQAAADKIRADGIHLLIDLSGHTDRNRLPVFAWRPAPVQASWLGYFATTGVAQIDYLLADEVGVPAERRGDFTEQICYLPETRLCFTPPSTELAPSPLPALTCAHITFGCFQLLPKITDGVLEAWARILAGVPQSRLRLQNRFLADPLMQLRLRERLARFGIDAGRVDMHGPTARADYLAAHAQIDMLLDSFPYPGGTTTCEALWMGVPTLTLAGDTLLARQGASLLSAAGLADWVAASTDEYVAKAIAAASDLPRLATLRATLRGRVAASPLFNAERFARNLELALWSIWERAQ